MDDATGVAGLEDVLRGGLAHGSLFLLEGSPGAGKTTIAMQFLTRGAAEGDLCFYITLSETEAELRASAVAHGWSLEGVEVFERLKPDRVVLDSLSEIRLLAQSSLRDRRQILALKHYFARQGATTFLTVAQHGLVGAMKSPVDLTYLADTVVLLRYFEAAGRVRRALSVVKKRTGSHEDTIGEFMIDARGLALGQPLTQFQGVLRGVPTWVGDVAPQLDPGP